MPLGRRSQEATFLTKKVLGVGAFGKVVCVLNKHSGAEYALKTGLEVSRMSSRLICVLVSISSIAVIRYHRMLQFGSIT